MKLGKWLEFETVSTDGSTTRRYSSPTHCNRRTGLKVRAKKYVRSVLLNRQCSLVGARLKVFSVPYPRTAHHCATQTSSPPAIRRLRGGGLPPIPWFAPPLALRSAGVVKRRSP